MSNPHKHNEIIRMKGTITNIQRMSIHDGPGIRTTVFFKGCNMRCAWCHNPETWNEKKQLFYVSAKCAECGTCISVCPTQVLSLTDNNKIAIDRMRCELNGICVETCPNEALTTVGKKVKVADVMKDILQDKIFFDESGGGVTLSGGEPMLQYEFARELLTACKAEGIHTAMDSNLTANRELIESFLPLVNLWMCDLKLADREKHKKWTGLYNERIIDNLHNLATKNVPVIVRTPIIPGVNNTEEEIKDICSLLKDMPNILYYELLEFHTFGFDKFNSLGIDNPLSTTAKLDKDQFNLFNKIPENQGIKIKTNYHGNRNL